LLLSGLRDTDRRGIDEVRLAAGSSPDSANVDELIVIVGYFLGWCGRILRGALATIRDADMATAINAENVREFIFCSCW
jgi:hypothetical protein